MASPAHLDVPIEILSSPQERFYTHMPLSPEATWSPRIAFLPLGSSDAELLPTNILENDKRGAPGPRRGLFFVVQPNRLFLRDKYDLLADSHWLLVALRCIFDAARGQFFGDGRPRLVVTKLTHLAASLSAETGSPSINPDDVTGFRTGLAGRAHTIRIPLLITAGAGIDPIGGDGDFLLPHVPPSSSISDPDPAPAALTRDRGYWG